MASLVERIIERLGYTKANTSPDIPLLDVMVQKYQESFGIEKPLDIESYGKAYSSDEWVYACVRSIAEAAMDVTFKLFNRVKKSGKYEKEEIIEHPAIDLLRRVNNRTTEDEFKELTITSLELQGNCYWYIVYDSLNIPREMYWCRPDWMKVIPGKDEYLKGYIYDSGHDKVTFEPQEILHFKYPSPRDFYYGHSPLTAARVAVEANIYSNIYSRNFFKNSSRPDGFLSNEKNLSEPQIKRLTAQWDKLFKGYNNSYKTAVLEAGMEYKLVGINQKDADFIAQQKNFREKILAIFRVPPAMVNIYEYANYANAEAQRKIFWADVLSKKLNRIANYYTEFLIRPIWGDDLFVEVDYSAIEVLQESITELIDRVTKLVGSGIYTPNEARQKLGDDVSTDPSMDMFYMPLSLIPVSGIKKPEPGKELEDLDIKKKHYSKIAENITRNRNRRLAPVLSEFQQSMEVAFDRQLKAVLKLIGRVQKDITPFDIEPLWAADEIGEILVKEAEFWVAVSIQKGIEGARDVTGIDLVFDATHPRIINAKDDILHKLKSMTDKTSIEELRGVITESISNQETVQQLKKRISDKFSDYKGYRAERIARTEAANSYGRASIEYYKEAGIEKKQWYTMNDDRVADICMDNQSQGVIPMTESFSSGVMNEPNHVNCRCSVVPVSE